MTKCKRRVTEGVSEPWLDFHIRSLHSASEIINNIGLNVHSKLDELKASWAAHISRFGIDGRPIHFLKNAMMCRNLSWWHSQKWIQGLLARSTTRQASEVRE